jgi:hypothetical protein
MAFGPRKLVDPAKSAVNRTKVDKWDPPLKDGAPKIRPAQIEPNAVSQPDPLRTMTRKPRG